MEKNKEDSPLQFLDDMAIYIASMTGIKNQFIEAGWKPEHAEEMVIELLRMSRNPSEKKEG